MIQGYKNIVYVYKRKKEYNKERLKFACASVGDLRSNDGRTLCNNDWSNKGKGGELYMIAEKVEHIAAFLKRNITLCPHCWAEINRWKGGK